MPANQMICRRTSPLLRIAVIGVALCALSPVSLSADAPSPAEKSHYDDLKDKGELIRQLQELAETYFENYVQFKTRNLRNLTESCDAKFHQLSFTVLTSMLSFNEFRLLQNQIDLLVENFQAEIARLKVVDEELDKVLALVKGMRSDLSAIAAKGLSPQEKTMIDDLLKAVEALDAELQSCHDDARAAITPAERALAGWQPSLDTIDKLSTDMNKYLTTPNDSPFFAETRIFLVPLLRHWVVSIPGIIRSKLPNSPTTWGMLAGAMLVTIPLLRLLLGFLLARISRWLPPASPSARKRLGRTFVYLSAGMVLLVGSGMITFPQSILVDALALLLLARWGLDFSWALNNYGREGRADSSPISHLFWIYAAATIYQFLNMPSQLLSFAWPTTLVAAAILARPVRKNAATAAFQRIHTLSICLILAFAILALFGLSELSMIMTGVWYMLAVAIQFGLAFCAFFRQFVENRLAERSELLRSLVIGLGVPTIWTASLACVVLWVGDQYFSIKKIGSVLSAVISVHGTHFAILDLAIAIFLFFAFKTCLDVATAAFERKYGEGGGKGVPALNSVLSYGVWALYAALLLLLLGVDFSSLAIAAGGLGVGIGIGLQSFINSFANGLSMLFSRVIREGDVILFDGAEATVLKIDLRNTMIRTSDNAITVVPNTDIIDKKLTNLTLNDPTVRRSLRVRVSNGSDIDKTRDLLMAAARHDARILKEPPPAVLLVDFMDDPVFELRVWIDVHSNDSEILSDLRFEINREFNRHGIQSPCTTVELRSVPVSEMADGRWPMADKGTNG